MSPCASEPVEWIWPVVWVVYSPKQLNHGLAVCTSTDRCTPNFKMGIWVDIMRRSFRDIGICRAHLCVEEVDLDRVHQRPTGPLTLTISEVGKMKWRSILKKRCGISLWANSRGSPYHSLIISSLYFWLKRFVLLWESGSYGNIKTESKWRVHLDSLVPPLMWELEGHLPSGRLVTIIYLVV